MTIEIIGSTANASSIAPGATGGPLYLTKNGAGAPPYSFAGDTNTGVDSSAADTLDLVTGGTSRFTLNTTSLTLTLPILGAGSSSAPQYSFSSDARDGMWRDTGTGAVVFNYIVPSFLYGDGKFVLKASNYFAWNADDNLIGSFNPDAFLRRAAAASLQMGNVAAASPVAQTFTVGQNSRAGTDSNVGGSSGTIRSGLGTGTGTASSLIFQTPTLAASGSGTQSYTTRLTINSSGAVFADSVQAFSLQVTGNNLTLPSFGLVYWSGRSIVACPADGVLTVLNEAQTDFGRLQFGGTTSSFPSLKRSSAALHCRLADDSADAVLQALHYKVAGTQVVGAQVTGVAVTAAAIHAALVTHGLITA